MAFSFAAKKILVTGAGRGLGRELAIKLAENDAKVFAVSKTASTLETLKEAHPSITTITLDLSDWNETRSVLKQLEPMDGLVNNAGLLPVQSSAAIETNLEGFNRFAKINLLSPINCTQIIAEKMISAGKPGSIVNVSSISAFVTAPGIFPYSVCKAGLDMVTKHFALELATNKIRVNSVNPTFFLSDGAKEIIKNIETPVLEEMIERTPRKSLPEVYEVVGPILFLLSDLSTAVSGTTNVIDCGTLCSLTG